MSDPRLFRALRFLAMTGVAAHDEMCPERTTMYRFLSGTIAEKSPTSVTLDVNGVGYELMVPVSTSQKLPDVSHQTKVLTHLVVREDAHLLFGFASEEERLLFRQLISVSGIGPKLAITILSGLGSLELKQAIVHGQIPVLTAISGIGRKTAERMIVELREKLVVESQETCGSAIPEIVINRKLVDDSLQALVSLGYNKQNAAAAIQRAYAVRKTNEWDVESLIRASLKNI
jgi:holliday junction DNA helicase RuvA